MTHNNNGQEFWLQEVPMEATDLTVRLGYLDHTTQGGSDYISLPDTGTWQIHSESLTITEEQAVEIVKRVGVLYEDYEYPEGLYMSAKSSYHSLLRSLGLEGKRIINLKKI